MRKGSFKNMKKLNKSNILSLIKDEEGISRAQIAEELGVSRATVTNIVKELINMKIVKEIREGESRGGRRPMLLDINAEGAYAIGFEWGIDSLTGVLLNLEAEILAEDRLVVEDNSLFEYRDLTVDLLAKFSKLIKDSDRIIGVGLGIHGLVDPEKGASLFTPHFNWGEINIKDLLKSEFKYPLFVDNDVRMMAEGELWEGKNDFVFINTGAGIGAALVFDGKIRYGVSNSAGEFGHIKISDTGPLCHCGKRGCLEALTSKDSILNNYLEKIREEKISEGFKEIEIEKELELINFAYLMDQYRKGDKLAVQVVNQSLNYFARGIADIVNLLNPGAVVIGGVFAEYAELFLVELKKMVSEISLELSASRLNIESAIYGKQAGAVGAAEKVLNNFFSIPE